MSPVPIVAVVLAGGLSRRMGSDKAWLAAPGTQVPLVLHQLALLRKLKPAALFVSARAGQALPALPEDVRRLDDDGTAGPLGGIQRSLQAAGSRHLLVVAVDLPQLDESCLRRLLTACTGTRGAVAGTLNGLEPLVAIFPPALKVHVDQACATGRLGLRALLVRPEVAKLVTAVEFADTARFTNWNHPTPP